MKNSPYLTVCLCMEDVDGCVIPLMEIASGHVFGPQQHLKLVLHGQDRDDSLHDLASSLYECCFPLVHSVSIAPTTSNSNSDYDVTLVFLTHSTNRPPVHAYHQSSNSNGKVTDTTSFNGFIATISQFLGNHIKHDSKILVLGPMANIAASLLSHRLHCSGGNQLLAFQTNTNAGRTDFVREVKKENKGQYSMASTLCQTVSNWWKGSESLSSKTVTAGIKFFNKRDLSGFVPDGGVFFSVPVDIVGEKTFKINPEFRLDLLEVNGLICETEAAFREMKIIDGLDGEISHTNVSFSQL